MVLDGYKIEKELHASSRSQLYAVRVVEGPRRPTCLYDLGEYLEGITLGLWMQKNPNPEIHQVLAIIKQVARGLRAFHQKETLHQDIKPDTF